MSQDCGADCDQVLADIEVFLDGELDGATSNQINVHLGDCPSCKGRADFESCVRDLLKSRCAETAPPALIARLEAKLAEWSV